MQPYGAMLKDRLARMLCATASTYFQSAPFALGKPYLWNHVVRPYLLWRDQPITAVTKFGAVLEGRLHDAIHNSLYFFGVWEPGITRIFQTQLRPGDVCIDIGANVGAHTLLAAHLVRSNGRVHAIEASPTIYQRLTRNLELNHLHQVTPYNVAVTDQAGPVTVFLHDATNLGATTIIASAASRRATTVEVVVDGRPLSGIVPIEEIKAARLIKIDVEGAEWLVLQGMRDVLPTLRPDCLVLLELNPEALAQQGRIVDDVVGFFGAYGLLPLEIENSGPRLDPRRPEFYDRRPYRVLSPEVGSRAADGGPTIDLGFAQPALRDALLQADRAQSGAS